MAATQVAGDPVPPLGHAAVLQSYHYLRDDSLAAWVNDVMPADTARLIFVDSGAFSARTVGAVITPEEYAEWLAQSAGYVDIAANLDVHTDETSNLVMLRRLRDLGADVLPVCHPGISWKQLESYCEEFPLILLGGMVGYKDKTALDRWLGGCFQVMSRHATVAHGFGLTNYKFVERFPFWSVDSTTWLAGCRFGAVNVCQGTKVYQVNVSDVAGNRLSPGLMRERYATLLGAGIPADVLAGKRRLEAGEYDRISFRAFRRWANAIRRHHGPVRLRDGSKPDGFHLFLASNPNRRGSGSVADLGSLWWET